MDLLIQHPDIDGFLDAMAAPLLAQVSAGVGDLSAAVTLLSPRRAPLTVFAGPWQPPQNGATARFTASPARTALRRRAAVRIGDTRTDHRWPGFTPEAAAHGQLSVLALPVELEEEGQVALTLLSPEAHDFPVEMIDRTHRQLSVAAKVLTLAVRLDRHRVLEQDLRTALTSRTAIDLAAGILMARHTVTQDQAILMLKQASQHRNLRLHDVAMELVEQLSLRTPRTHFES